MSGVGHRNLNFWGVRTPVLCEGPLVSLLREVLTLAVCSAVEFINLVHSVARNPLNGVEKSAPRTLQGRVVRPGISN